MDKIIKLQGKAPQVHEDTFIADGAKIIGEVTLDKGVNIWYNAILRGDLFPITVGEYSNIQDNCVVHVGPYPAKIGSYVTVGHTAILHACVVEDYCLIGMGAVVLDGAKIGEGAIVGAGALVTGGTEIPPFSVAVGNPARVIKTLDESSREDRKKHAVEYYELCLEQKELQGKGL